MGLDCSAPRKPILDQISLDILRQIKKKYPLTSKLIKQPKSPIINTPVVKINPKTFLKLENLQTSGSFKIRGAYLYFQNYQDQQIVVASTGNFAKASYYAYRSCNEENDPQESQIFHQQKEQYDDDEYQTPTPIPDEEKKKVQYNKEELDKSNLIIFVPENVSKVKLKDIDCPIIYQGKDCLISEQKAKEFAKQHGSIYASPYNDINMILGSCTIGEELEQYFQECGTELDYIFVSCGGGGLIGGIALYFKYLKNTKTRIIGVQPKINAAMYNILKGKQDYQLNPTLSDGTSGGVEETSITIQICKYLVDDWILVKEEQIRDAQQKLLNEQKMIVEGAAALAYAGFLQYPIGNCVCAIVLCGSNIDPQNLLKDIV